MIHSKSRRPCGPWLPLASIAALMLAAGCGSSERLSPSVEAPSTAAPAPGDSAGTTPVDSTLLPPDSLAGLPTDSTAIAGSALAAGTQPGIVFGSYGMEPSHLNSVHTGTMRGGGITELNVISFLKAVQLKRGRVVLKMVMGEDKYVKNADGTFSFTKWKGLVDRFTKVDLGPFIKDGTLMGHFLIDEPHRTAKWGGKIIHQSTVEAMAAYSKKYWPTLPTIARVVPSWLAKEPILYRALDAGWLQYAYDKGDPVRLVNSETTIAKSKGLGLVVGLNVLDGGNGSSGVRGWASGRWSMSATEIRNYGSAMLNQTHACGFFNWAYMYQGLTYWNRTDIAGAFKYLSDKARLHTRTSCSY